MLAKMVPESLFFTRPGAAKTSDLRRFSQKSAGYVKHGVFCSRLPDSER